MIYLFQIAMVLGLINWAKKNRSKCVWDETTAKRRRNWSIAGIAAVQIGGVASFLSTGDPRSAGIGTLIQLPCAYLLALSLYRLGDLRRGYTPQAGKRTWKSELILAGFAVVIVVCVFLVAVTINTRDASTPAAQSPTQVPITGKPRTISDPDTVLAAPDVGWSSRKEMDTAVAGVIVDLGDKNADAQIVRTLVKKGDECQVDLDRWQNWARVNVPIHEDLLMQYATLKAENERLKQRVLDLENH